VCSSTGGPSARAAREPYFGAVSAQNPFTHSAFSVQHGTDAVHLSSRPAQLEVFSPHVSAPEAPLGSQKPLQHWSPVWHDVPFLAHGSSTQKPLELHASTSCADR
jgi:hypothetical protein